jgi:hypothetical protein
MVLTSTDTVQTVQQLRLTELTELQVGMAHVTILFQMLRTDIFEHSILQVVNRVRSRILAAREFHTGREEKASGLSRRYERRTELPTEPRQLSSWVADRF